MNGADWSLVADVFADAIELPVEARPAFLADRCAGRSDVREAVERMLAAEKAVDPSFLRGLDALAIDAVVGVVTQAPESVGPYRLVREIGRGGTGRVFLARRADGHFEQHVAVKLLKRGLDTDAILARFVRERQILADLNHPNIARLLDGGRTDAGHPYLVMEYVDGQPITEYCDQRRLSIDERLELFSEVCRAVEFAHRNLVVHRDLKPSNILITAEGEPKLLDFGIAKVLSSTRRADPATLTRTDDRMLTPEYAAPEQFHGGAITTSTDVYSLGVVLYELLAGRRPFSARTDALPAARQLDDEAPPLTRVATTAPHRGAVDGDVATVDDIAAARSSDPAGLRRRLAGDLETIAATALRPLPERRYASVEAMRDDIARHQQQLPVKARPATVVYRVSRFVRRNRLAVLSASSMAVLLLAFGAVSAFQAERIRGQAVELEAERDRARSEAAAAEQVADFLVGVFEVSDPMSGSGGDSITARELLDRGAQRIETDLEGQPAMQARLLGVVGRAYDNLSQGDHAETLMRRVVELQRSTEGDTSAAVVTALHELAVVQGRRDPMRAASTLQEALARQQRLDPDNAVTWALLVDLALAFHREGDTQKADSAATAALASLDGVPVERLGAEHESMSKLIVLLRYRGDWQKLDVAYRHLIDMETTRSGRRSAAVASAFANWAEARLRAGAVEHNAQSGHNGSALSAHDGAAQSAHNGADSLVSTAHEIVRELDSSSLESAEAAVHTAAAARSIGALPQADSLYRLALAIYRARLGDEHRQVALVATNLAMTLLRRGMADQAVPLFEDALSTYRGGSEFAHLVAVTEWRLAAALRAAGRSSESVQVFRQSLAGFEATFPPDYILTANVRHEFARLLIELDRAAEAERLVRLAIPVLAARWGIHDVRVDDARITLATALTALGRYADADETLAGPLDRVQAGRSPDDAIGLRARDARRALDRERTLARGGA